MWITVSKWAWESVSACHIFHNWENHKSEFGTLDSPEGVEVSGLRAISWWLWEQRPSRIGIQLRGTWRVLRAARPRGGGRGSPRSRGWLQGAPLSGFVGCNCIVSPVGARTGGARRVGAGGFTLSSLSLTASFSLMVAVGWNDGGKSFMGGGNLTCQRGCKAAVTESHFYSQKISNRISSNNVTLSLS